MTEKGAWGVTASGRGISLGGTKVFLRLDDVLRESGEENIILQLPRLGVKEHECCSSPSKDLASTFSLGSQHSCCEISNFNYF